MSVVGGQPKKQANLRYKTTKDIERTFQNLSLLLDCSIMLPSQWLSFPTPVTLSSCEACSTEAAVSTRIKTSLASTLIETRHRTAGIL